MTIQISPLHQINIHTIASSRHFNNIQETQTALYMESKFDQGRNLVITDFNEQWIRICTSAARKFMSWQPDSMKSSGTCRSNCPRQHLIRDCIQLLQHARIRILEDDAQGPSHQSKHLACRRLMHTSRKVYPQIEGISQRYMQHVLENLHPDPPSMLHA